MTTESISGIAIDLESMAKSPNGIILSVGMCRFDVARKTIWDEFQVNIDAKDSARYGMIADEETVQWWSTQPKEVLRSATKNPETLDTALTKIRGYIEKTKNPNIWSYGSLFDFPMLEWSFRAAGYKNVPWSFRKANCARTMSNVFGAFSDNKGVKHTALDDAKWLAQGLIDFYAGLTAGVDDDIPF